MFNLKRKSREPLPNPNPLNSSAESVHDEGTREKIFHLQKVALLEDIRDNVEALRELSRRVSSQAFQPGDAIIREGDQGSELYILFEGDASVYKTTPEGEKYKVAVLKGSFHAFFGEGGLLDSEPRSATIVAESPLVCLVLDKAHFDDFCRAYPQWALPISLRIARVVLQRLSKTNTDLMLLYNALVAEIRG
jgi:CRP/FNR family cyclic AMP-dependent transcriptional regulator